MYIVVWSSRYSSGHEIDGSRIRWLLESVSWPCVVTQVKYGFHVLIWTAWKERKVSMKLVVDLVPIHGNAFLKLQTLNNDK